MNVRLDFLNNKGFDVGDIVRIYGTLGIVIVDIDKKYNILCVEDGETVKKGELWSGYSMTEEELAKRGEIELIRKSKDVKITIE